MILGECKLVQTLWKTIWRFLKGGSWEETPQARGQGRLPGGTTRGAMAAQAQEGLEEPSHVEGQEGRR